MDQNNRSYTQLTSQKLDVPGLVFRSFQGEADYSKMAAVIAASAKADGHRLFQCAASQGSQIMLTNPDFNGAGGRPCRLGRKLKVALPLPFPFSGYGLCHF